MSNGIKITALITVRNGESYIARCLKHLSENGINFIVIDNESTDNSLNIAHQFYNNGLISVEHLPYNGNFDLVAQLTQKLAISEIIESDWFVHQDIDEVLESPIDGLNLKQALTLADQEGYNTVNFNEFVFLPDSDTHNFEDKDYVKEMQYYYFFEPFRPRLLRAWKKGFQSLSFVESGGHLNRDQRSNIYPIDFNLRHYIFLSYAHAVRKYTVERTYSEDEIKTRNWHGWRGDFAARTLLIPDRDRLKKYGPGLPFDISDPQSHHMFII